MIGKIHTGVDFFDKEFGGVYQGRAMLASGPSGSGKTFLGLQFIAKGLRLEERCLILSAQSAHDTAIRFQSLGISLEEAIESKSLIILEYSHLIPGQDQNQSAPLSPEGFYQLCEMIEREVVTRVVIDTVLPWVALPTSEHLPEHVFSFIRAFERMNTTCLFTIPKPVSALAVRLHRLMEEYVPISVILSYDKDDDQRRWMIKKYLGADRTNSEFEFKICPDKGLCLEIGVHQTPSLAEKSDQTTPSAPATKTTHRPASPSAPSKFTGGFAEIMLGNK